MDKGSDSITLGKDTFYGIVIVLLAGLLVLSVFTQGFGIIKVPAQPAITQPTVQAQQPTAQPTQQPTNPAPTTATFSGPLAVNLGNYPALGQDSAPVSIVEFSDFQCPFCSKFYFDAEAKLRQNYINSGKVKFYYRDFPLTSIHPDAMPGAVAARCANDQGKFWAMHDQLFTTQGAWSALPDPKSDFDQYATSLGLDVARFDACYTNQSHVSEINADEAQGQTYGVQGTPGVFIILPKAKMTAANMQSAMTTINNQFGAGALVFYENSDSYVVFVPGAYPFAAFDDVLSKVSY